MRKKLTRQQRQEALRNRVKANVANRKSSGGVSKSVLSLEGYSDVQFFRPKEGRYYIDIIPWIVQTDKLPQGMEPGEEDYLLDIFVHYKIGQNNKTVVCLKKTCGRDCPVCEEREILEKDEKPNKKLIAELYPKRRAIYNIIDLDDKDKGIQIFDVSHKLFEKEMLEEAQTRDGEIIIFSDIEEGKTVEFRASNESVLVPGQTQPIKFVGFKSFRFEDRKPYTEEIFDRVYPLDKMLKIYEYEELRKIFHGIEEEEESLPEPPKQDEPYTMSSSVPKATDPAKEENKPPFEVEKPEVKQDTPSDIDSMNKRQLRQLIRKEGLDIRIDLKMTEGDIKAAIKKARNKGKVEEKKEAKIECPNGMNFGADCDADDLCMDCNVYDACAEELNKLNSK